MHNLAKLGLFLACFISGWVVFWFLATEIGVVIVPVAIAVIAIVVVGKIVEDWFHE